MEKGIQRGETQEIPWRTDPGGLRKDTYSKAVKLAPGLQSPVLLKMGGRRVYQVKKRSSKSYGKQVKEIG